jgi:hypothetical protein
MEHIDNNIYKQVNNNIYRQDPQAEAEEIRETAAGHEESPPPPNAMEMDSALKDAAYWSGKLEMLNKADEENQRQYAETYDSDEDEDDDDNDDEEEYDDDEEEYEYEEDEDAENELTKLARDYAEAKFANSSLANIPQNLSQKMLIREMMNSISELAEKLCENSGHTMGDFEILVERIFIDLARKRLANEYGFGTTRKNDSNNVAAWPDVGKIVNGALRGAEKGVREAGRSARNAAKNARGAVRGMNLNGLHDMFFSNNGNGYVGGSSINPGQLQILLQPIQTMIEAASEIGNKDVQIRHILDLTGFLRDVYKDIKQSSNGTVSAGQLQILLQPIRDLVEVVSEIDDENMRVEQLSVLMSVLREIYNDTKQD